MYTKFSWFEDSLGEGKHPLDVGQGVFKKQGQVEGVKYTGIDPLNNPEPVKGKYDWTQAARLGKEDRPMEVGPLAQILIAYLAGRTEAKQLVDSTLAAIGAPGQVQVLMSNLGRIAARVLKAKINADNAVRWAEELLANIRAGKTNTFIDKAVPTSGEGIGGWDAPRGALCHYIRIKNGVIGEYAAVPPSNWNLSPRDDKGVRGPVEEALIGTQVVDPAKPLEILRVVHTFDP